MWVRDWGGQKDGERERESRYTHKVDIRDEDTVLLGDTGDGLEADGVGFLSHCECRFGWLSL